jgi:hypothetical protein
MLQVLNPFRVRKEFRRLKSEKKWMLALIAVFLPGLLSVVGSGLIQQKMQPLTNQYVREMGALTEAQVESMESIQSFIAVIGMVVGVIAIAVVWIGKSVIFHVIARVLGGEEVDVSSTIHIIAYTYLPLVFKGIIDIWNGLQYQPPPYEEFIRQLQNPDLVMTFVREHNLFFFWVVCLTIVAVKEQFSMSWKKSVVVVGIPYIVFEIIQILLASLGAQLAGGM